MKVVFRIILFVIISLFVIIPVAFSQSKPVITVLDFNANNISKSDMSLIVSFLSSSIYDLGLFDVIDSSQRDVILSELNFSNSGCSDESCQLEIGKLLSAEYIIVGDIGKVGERYLITAKLLETETSRTVGNAKGLYGDINRLVDSLHVLAKDLGDKYLKAKNGDGFAAESDRSYQEPEISGGGLEKTPLEIMDNENAAAESAEISEAGKQNMVTPISFISSAVCGGAAIGSYIYSSIKYQEYTESADVATAESLHNEVALFDTIAVYAAGLAAASLISGFVSWLFF